MISGSSHYLISKWNFPKQVRGLWNFSLESKCISLAIVPVSRLWSLSLLSKTLAGDNQALRGVTESQIITGLTGSWWEELARVLSQSSRDLCQAWLLPIPWVTWDTSHQWPHLWKPVCWLDLTCFFYSKSLLGEGFERIFKSCISLCYCWAVWAVWPPPLEMGQEPRVSVTEWNWKKYAKPSWWHTPVISALGRWRQEN